MRAHRAVVALAHRVEHRDDLVAAHLADDDAIGVHAQAHADELGGGDLPDALDVGFAGFERDDVGMEVGEAVEAELEFGLDGDDALVGRDLARQARAASWSSRHRWRRRR